MWIASRMQLLVLAIYATAALSIVIGTAWYSGPHLWVRRILVAWALLLHAAISCSPILMFAGSSQVLAGLVVVGSIAFTVWMYWLGRHPSIHLVQLINLSIVVILIQNYRTRHLYGVGLLGHWIS
jgi:hypothetical protein